MKTPFFGAHSVSRSLNYADCQLINLYGEVDETKQGREIGALYAFPGLTQVASAGSGPINGMLQLGTGKLYVVSGTTLYSVDSGYTVTSIGALTGTPIAPMSMIQNGTQLNIFSNGFGTLFSVGGGISSLTMPFSATGPIIASYQDGFGLIHQPGTNSWFHSALLDLSSYPALNTGSASGDPDNILALAQTHRLVYTIKQNETEVWVNAGTSPFTFARAGDGAYFEVGTAAATSVAKLDESIFLLGQNVNGNGIVVQVDGFSPRKISTNAMDTEVEGYATISDAIGYGYQYGGHSFYVLTFPTQNTTWVYDKTTSDLLRAPFWSKWLGFQASAFTRHYSNCFAFFNGVPLVGSYLDGKIYKLDPTALADGAFTRKWLRSWRAVPQISMVPTRFPTLNLDMEMGGTGTVGTPNVTLQWSDDGGHTLSSGITASPGALGATAVRVRFTRIGSTRRNHGLDRIFQLSSSDTFPARLIGASFDD